MPQRSRDLRVRRADARGRRATVGLGRHALLLAFLLTSICRAQDREGGLVGSFKDPGSGVLVSGRAGAAKVEAVFEVGSEGRAPFAREHVTLAPTTKVVNRVLVVSPNFKRERVAAKIPGGLGAFWEMDLQSEEGALFRNARLEVGAISLQTTKQEGGQIGFPLPPGMKAPYTVLFDLQFFGRSESFRFRIDEGSTSFQGTGTDGPPREAGGTGVDPALPKADQPPDTFTRTPAREGALAPQVPPPGLNAPPGWQEKRGTWLTPTELKDRPQDLMGLWIDADSQTNPELEWFANEPAGTLEAGPAKLRGEQVTFLDMRRGSGSQWKGLVHVCPRPPGTCPNLCRWVRGSVQLDPGNFHARGEWHATHSKSDCSGFTADPDSGPLAFKRFIGTSFVPLVPGKYLYLIAAPAVGNQPAQFKAAAKLAARYEGTSAANVKATSSRGILNLVDKNSGTYEFVTDRSGVYEIRFDLVGSDGKVFHQDRLRIDIPSIPGLGN